MSSLLTLLNERGLSMSARVKVVRHADTRPGMDVIELERQGWLEVYQSYQPSRIFQCDYVVSTIGIPGGRARFFGVYRITQPAKPTPQGNLPPKFPRQDFDGPGNYYYHLERDHRFDDLVGHLIEWNAHPKNWDLWLIHPKRGRDMTVVTA